jgi:methylglutaconyl-CoA hydratase
VTQQQPNGPPVRVSRSEAGAVTVVLNRPHVHNAFDEQTIEALSDVFLGLADDPGARVVVLRGEGRSFSSGGDANWMRRMAGADRDANEADAQRLALMLRRLEALPQPVICAVHGNAFGGAIGLISACDIAIAADDARFALSEVRLGLVPAVISPFVLAAIGARHARHLFLTGETFGADEALRIGLVHALVPPGELDARIAATLEILMLSGPQAQREAKRLLSRLVADPTGDAGETDRMNAALIARIRESGEGREGLEAFLGKRKPSWQQ